VFGKRTRPIQTFSRGPFGLTGVVFTPQGLSTLLKTHPTSLSDRSAALDEFSREHIGEQLLDARSDRERVARLGAFVRAHLVNAGPADALVTESLRLIQNGLGAIRVPHLLKCLHVSERQFERRFARAIGVSPHQYIRIARFQQALRLMRAGRFERLSDVAQELDYADQSHFIKDVKALSGYTPTDLLRAVRTGIRLPCALIVAPDHAVGLGASPSACSQGA
jgi:AraC-like DNA-binding protein